MSRELKRYKNLSKEEIEKLHTVGIDVMHNLHCVQKDCNEPVMHVHPVGMPLCEKHSAKKYWNAVSESCKALGMNTNDGQKWFK